MASWPLIGESARRHGVSDDAMRHAFRNAIRAYDLDQGIHMLIGADESGRLLEVGVVTSDDGDPVLVHAMPARKKFLR